MNYNYKVNTRNLEFEACSDAWDALDDMCAALNHFLSAYDTASAKVVIPVDVISPDQVLSLVTIRDSLEEMEKKVTLDINELRKDV